MKFLKQTKLGRNGNCFEACIASIVESNIDDVPNLMPYIENGKWIEKLNFWLGLHFGLAYIEMKVPIDLKDEFFGSDFIYILIGDTVRNGTIKHAVIYRKTEMIFDPHPDNVGLIEPSDEYRVGVFAKTFIKK
jgi:hypothetical protein